MTNQALDGFEDGLDDGTIELDRITRDWSLQVRGRMDDGAVARYAAAMEAGSEFPPVELGEVGSSLLLVDGWHRIEAARRVGRSRILARITAMTREEAQWGAAKANLAHGVPLTRRIERTNVFRAYVESGQHRKKRGYKSYREMSEELLGLAGHTTIRHWMFKFFPRVARGMGNGETIGNTGAETPATDPDATNFPAAMQALADALNIARVLQSDELRYALAERSAEVLRDMRAMPLQQPEENSDF